MLERETATSVAKNSALARAKAEAEGLVATLRAEFKTLKAQNANLTRSLATEQREREIKQVRVEALRDEVGSAMIVCGVRTPQVMHRRRRRAIRREMTRSPHHNSRAVTADHA